MTYKKIDTINNPKPFLKWVGGKRQLVKELLALSPKEYNCYFEPFLGGGALYFALKPAKAFLSDINPELINAFQCVRDKLDQLILSLSKHRYDKEHFYAIRSLDRKSDFNEISSIEKASRLIFLNKTCYNGLYRLSKKGYFNAPFGRYKNPKILDTENLLACSRVLKNSELWIANYRNIIDKIKKNDFVYLDPPYVPISKTSNFTSYTKESFDLNDQYLLKEFCDTISKKGGFFMLSNSYSKSIIDLYNGYNIEKVLAKRMINSNASKRGDLQEVIIRNYN